MEPFSETEIKETVTIYSRLNGLDGKKREVVITLMEDKMPRAVAFFDIDKTMAELKDIHGNAIRILFKEIFNKDFDNIEEVYFKGFRLGNSFREFDRMNGIYGHGNTSWIDPEVYIKERLYSFMKEIDTEGTEDHTIAQLYLNRYVEIASSIAEDIYKNNPQEFELTKIKPIFALAHLYKALGIPMFGMTANGRKFVEVLSQYLGLSDIFVDIATDEDMVGGGKEIVIPKLLHILEEEGIKISLEKLVIVGDSLRGDIGSGHKYKMEGTQIGIKGILVVQNKDELSAIKQEISKNRDLRKIIENTDTEALIINDVPIDEKGNPLLFASNRGNFVVKL